VLAVPLPKASKVLCKEFLKYLTNFTFLFGTNNPSLLVTYGTFKDFNHSFKTPSSKGDNISPECHLFHNYSYIVSGSSNVLFLLR